jgi:hypothetical protein
VVPGQRSEQGLGSRLIKATRRERLQGRQMRDNFGPACRIVSRYA